MINHSYFSDAYYFCDQWLLFLQESSMGNTGTKRQSFSLLMTFTNKTTTISRDLPCVPTTHLTSVCTHILCLSCFHCAWTLPAPRAEP